MLLQGVLGQDYVVAYEKFGDGVERLTTGAAIEHRLDLPLRPGRWLVTVTVSASLSNVSWRLGLEGGGPGLTQLGGGHDGAMSPHFGPALAIGHFDGVQGGGMVRLTAAFERIGPHAVAVLGPRVISVSAWRHADAAERANPAPRSTATSRPAARARTPVAAPEPVAAPAKAAAAAKSAPAKATAASKKTPKSG